MVWVDIQDPGPEELSLLLAEFGFHPLALEDVSKGQQRPKVEEYKGYLFAVTYSAAAGATAEDFQLAEIHLFVGRNYLVSIHRGRVPVIDEAMTRWSRGGTMLTEGVGFAAYTVLDAIIDSYFPVIDAIEDGPGGDRNGDAVRGPEGGVEKLLRYKRSLFTLRRILYPLREMFHVFLRRDQPMFSAEHRGVLPECYDHILRILDALDMEREMAASGGRPFGGGLQSDQRDDEGPDGVDGRGRHRRLGVRGLGHEFREGPVGGFGMGVLGRVGRDAVPGVGSLGVRLETGVVMKVLVVDDDAFSRRLLLGYLEKWGYAAVPAENGVEAWDRLQAEDFPLVIADWMMPEMDGVELVRRIRAWERSEYTYVILVTARSQKEDLVEGMEAGADDFLSKPFDRDELRVRLREGERIVRLERIAAEQTRRFEQLQTTLAEQERLAACGRRCEQLAGDLEASLSAALEDLRTLQTHSGGARRRDRRRSAQAIGGAPAGGAASDAGGMRRRIQQAHLRPPLAPWAPRPDDRSCATAVSAVRRVAEHLELRHGGHQVAQGESSGQAAETRNWLRKPG